MTKSIQKQLAVLAELQKADTNIAELERELAGVDAHISGLEEQLTTFKDHVQEATDQLEMLKKQYREDEGEVQGIETGIDKSDGKLHSVKTNKEYQSILKEIEDLKQKKSMIEDQMLETLESIEAVESKSASLSKDYADLMMDIEGQQAEIRRQAEEKNSALEQFREQRNDLWESLLPNLQKMYARAKQLGGGTAVAAVIESVCQVCRVNLPPQLFIELMRMNSLIMCPNCQRIIYPQEAVEDD